VKDIRGFSFSGGLSFALELAFTVVESFAILSLPSMRLDPNFQKPHPCFLSTGTTT
jgi:hypothetical protein